MSRIARHTDQSNSLTTFSVDGTLTLKEILDVLKTFKAEPPAKNILWDFSKANVGYSFNVTDLQKTAIVAKSNIGLRPNSKTAFVATSDIGFGLIRMYTTFLELQEIAHEIQVFRSLEEAYQWLEEG
jgi:hypothetical protein